METNQIIEMGGMEIFKNEQFGEVRTVMQDGEPLFCLSDVAKALEYANPAKAVIDHCKGVTVLETPTKNQWGTTVMQQMKYGKESEVYRLIMKAKTPKAEAFQDWVCGEVLPSIRKHGAYMTTETLEQAITSPDFLIKLATNLKKEQEARRIAEEKAEQQQALNEANRPKVVFADTLLSSVDGVSFDTLAKFLTQKGIAVGRNTLIKWMRRDGFLFKSGTRPIQKYMEMGLFTLRPVTYTNPHDGSVHSTTTTLITGNGQMYLLNYYIKKHTAA